MTSDASVFIIGTVVAAAARTSGPGVATMRKAAAAASDTKLFFIPTLPNNGPPAASIGDGKPPFAELPHVIPVS